MRAPPPRTRSIAEGGLLVEYPGADDADANRAAVDLAGAIAGSRPEGLLDAIPGARALLLLFDPLRLARENLEKRVLDRAARPAPARETRTVSIGVCYGVERGADLLDVAARAGLSPEEVVRRHAAGDYAVGFVGFAPGFAYLTGLDPALHAPRLSTPRPRVPAGSVAIGGPYTGIYPASTPGGWRLIGRSPVRLFDEDAEPPSLLQPGDRVRFAPIGETEFAALAAKAAGAARIGSTPAGARALFRVAKPGLFTSAQGAPRFGMGASGVPPGGAMDGTALRSGNEALGNPAGTAALEMTLLGPEIEILGGAALCLSGAEMGGDWNGSAIEAGRPFRVRAGDRLRFSRTRRGARAYLCVEGGVLTPGRLGLTRRLEAGDVVTAKSRRHEDAETPGRGEVRTGSRGGETGRALEREILLRLVLDPREWFEKETVDLFLSSPYRVSATSDRRGIRLEGAPVAAAGSSEIPPEGTCRGTIQVPRDGMPIVLGADRPITGGYAKLGTVIGADWPLMAQAAPGDTARFAAVTLDQARAARE